MKKSFFSESSFKSDRGNPTTPHCGLCGLYKNCLHPKIKPTGKGLKKILIVAEAPGKEEDRQGKHLVGQAGKLLKRTVRKSGIDLYKDCWVTNAIICRREKNTQPDDKKIEACRPNLIKTIRELKPNVIILLGSVATKSLIPIIFKSDVDRINRWGGYYIPCHDPNSWITSTFHPSHVLKEKNPVVKIEFEKHIRGIIKKAKNKPWKIAPDYESQIEIIMNPAQAAKELKCMMAFGGNISFDYECNCLKPDGDGTKIITCSVCWENKKTIAFPWKGSVVEEMSKLLKSSIGKIGANIKFENRWTKKHLGHYVKNWIHDTMIAAHVLNNSPKVTGLIFQAFVNLGMPCYDKDIKPFLKAKKNSKFNQIEELDLKDLLLYNGLDSLLTFLLAKKQMKEFERMKNGN